MLKFSALFILMEWECNQLHKAKQLSEHPVCSGLKISVSVEIYFCHEICICVIYLGHEVLSKEGRSMKYICLYL
jgi:hypothetical protein